MPDPMSPAIAFYYVDDDVAMHQICSFLVLKKGEWFDVRRPSKHKWSICFSAIIVLPKDLAKKLIAVQPQETEIERNVATYKAKRAAELKGSRTRNR